MTHLNAPRRASSVAHHLRMPRSRFTLALLALSCLSTGSLGQAAAEESPARAHFERGAKAYRDARYKEAIDSFLEAYRLDRDPALIFNVGQAWEKLGNVPNALRSYREYLRLSPTAEDRVTVEASIRNLEKRLAEKGVQQVTVYSSPSGAEVHLDGKLSGKTPWTGEIAPGRHEVVLKLSGHRQVKKEFVLSADRAMDLDVGLDVGESGAAQRATGPTQPEEPKERPRRVRLWTYLAFGAGVACLGGALGFELASRSSESSAKENPPQIQYKDLYDEAQSRKTAARVFLGVGLAAVAAGGVLLYFDLSRGRSKETSTASNSPSLAGGCGPEGCGVTFTMDF